MRSIAAAGVPLGAIMAPMETASKPLKPCSATVLTSGTMSTRLGEPTASARSLPLLMCGSAATKSLNITGTWPPSKSFMAGALPL